MRRILHCLIFIFILDSCSEEQHEQTMSISTIDSNASVHSLKKNKYTDNVPIENEDSIEQLKKEIANYRMDFKTTDAFFSFHHVKEIRNFPPREKIPYRQLTAQEYYEAFQHKAKVYYDASSEGVYYVADQGVWRGMKRYIFLQPDENCCLSFYYNIYDEKGKQLNSFVIAQSGGDGGWETLSQCNFLNDSTLQINSMDCEEDENNKTTCDTIVDRYHILSDGQFQREQIFHQTTNK